MASRKIISFGDLVLRRVAQPVSQLNGELYRILDDMADTLYEAEGRAGLAAPQIGVSQRVIVIDCGADLIELINPEIVRQEGEQIGPEACLSYPGYTGILKRAQSVEVKSLNRNGKEFLLKGDAFLARCLQHEIDHLNGILFIDHIQDGLFFADETRKRINLAEVLRLSKSKPR